jgi:uncharacterized protein (TIGR00661 family)
MRILYGVFGYGRGHAARAEAMLPELLRRHEVFVLAGGDAFAALTPRFPVIEIPTLRLIYGDNGVRCLRRTIQGNLGHVADLYAHTGSLRRVIDVVRDLAPDAAICDGEPWTHRACGTLGIPRVSFDHYGVLAYCTPELSPGDRARAWRDVLTYRGLVGRPARVLVSSFFSPPRTDSRVRVVAPLLRDEVRARAPREGDHLLVYFNQGDAQITARVEEMLHALRMPVVVYGAGARAAAGSVVYRAASTDGFLDDLASCRAILSTAGNQLVGEAIHFRKPMLVVPENTVEQRMNAIALERVGIGERTDVRALSASRVRAFLANERAYTERARTLRSDGREEALRTLEAWMRELGTLRRSLPALAWRFA